VKGMPMIHIPTLVVGLAVTGFGIFLTLFFIRSRNSCTMQTEGVVIGHRSVTNQTDSGSDTYFYELVSYTVNDVSYKHKRKSGAETPQYQEGDKVTLYYDPGKPKRSRMEDDKKDKPILGPLCIILGIGIMIFSFYIY